MTMVRITLCMSVAAGRGADFEQAWRDVAMPVDSLARGQLELLEVKPRLLGVMATTLERIPGREPTQGDVRDERELRVQRLEAECGRRRAWALGLGSGLGRLGAKVRLQCLLDRFLLLG